MNVTIRRRILYNVKHGHAVCLKFGGRFFTSLTMLGFEAKVSYLLCNQRKSNFVFIFQESLIRHLPFHCYKLTSLITKSASQ